MRTATCMCNNRWIITVWCLFHRLDLSLMDVLKNTLFSCVDDFLMQLYTLHSKSPKTNKQINEN